MPTASRRLLLGAGLAALGARAWRRPAWAAAQPQGAPAALTLGALFPLSGPLALLGDESFRGLDLAADERNATGGVLGRAVRLERGDATEPARAADEAVRLMSQAGVSALVGSYASAVAMAASTAADHAGVPYLELDALADAVTQRGLRCLWRTGPTATHCATLAVDTVVDVLAPRWQIAPADVKIVVLHEDGVDGTSLATAQMARCKDRGLAQANTIAYGAATLDLGPVAHRLRSSEVDVVLHSGLANDVVLFHRTLQQIGWRPRMVIGSGGGYALNDTAATLGPAFEGVMVADVTPYRVSDVVAPGAAGVAAAYQRKYGAPPRSGHSLICYAGALVFFDLIQAAGGLEPEKLRAAALAADIPPGATVGGFGVRFDERGQNLRATPYLAQWQSGSLVAIAPGVAAVAQLLPTLG